MGHYKLQLGLLLRKKKVVPSEALFKRKILHHIHDHPTAGHLNFFKTYQKAKRDFYWSNLKKYIKRLVRECEIFQANKYETTIPTGLLQALSIPQQAQIDVSMDFIKVLPNSHGVTTILVVVDRYTKYRHFMTLKHPYTAISVAKVFLDFVFKLHGFPNIIVSDNDPIFLNSFQELFALQGTSLNYSSAYHSQSYG